jgi:hypothetical protein
MSKKTEIDVEGKALTVSNLEKVMYPEVDFRKSAGHRFRPRSRCQEDLITAQTSERLVASIQFAADP